MTCTFGRVLLAAVAMSALACEDAGDAPPGEHGYAGTFRECVTGVWTSGDDECYCPADAPWLATEECDAPDCRETDVLALLPDGHGVEVLVRWSDTLRQLSSPYGPSDSTWTVTPEHALVLDYGSHELVTPATCGPERLEREFDGSISANLRASPALADAVREAYRVGEWEAVPYEP